MPEIVRFQYPIDATYSDDFSSFGRRGFGVNVKGLVRIDRALLYIRQRIRSVIAGLEARNTKTIGEVGESLLYRLQNDVTSLCRMSGDRQLESLVRSGIGLISNRTIRLPMIAALKELLSQVEAYEPPPEIAGYGELREKIATLEHQLGDAHQERATQEQLSDEKSVFIIMPFSAEFTDVWKGGIQRAAQAEGFNPIRVDMINRSTNITDDIVAGIERCRLAIVDVTGNNPNVMFELGYAIARQKKNIVISQSADFLPFDIRNIRTIVYANTWSGIEELKGRVQEFLREAAPSKHSKTTKSAN